MFETDMNKLYMYELQTGIRITEPWRGRKRTFWHVCPTKTQISLRIRTVWSESLLWAWRNIASLAIQNTPREDSDQTVRKTFSDVVA